MFRAISICSILGMIAAIGIYHALIRIRRITAVTEGRSVLRCGLLERALHALATLCVIVLGCTGLATVTVFQAPLAGWLGLAHMAAAPVFAVSMAIVLLIWAPDGRFDAGQKVFLWFTALAALIVTLTGVGRMSPVFGAVGQVALYEAHRYSALALVLAAIVHLYLRTIANPGTLWAMISGYVSPDWAKRHHPIWFERVKGGKEGDV